MNRESLRNLDWGLSPHENLAERTAFLRSKRYPPPQKRQKVIKTPFERLSKSQQEFISAFKVLNFQGIQIWELNLGKKKPKLELWLVAQDGKLEKIKRPTIKSLIKAGFLKEDFTPREDSESWRSIP